MEQQLIPEQNKHLLESDTEMLVRRHLSGPNHIITDEELAAVRTGMLPGPDVVNQQAIEEREGRASSLRRRVAAVVSHT